LNIVAEPANKATTNAFRPLDANILSYYRSGQLSLQLLTDNIGTGFVCFYFKNFSPYFESLNYKIDQMLSAGIISHWFKKEELKIKFDEIIGPQVLTWEHLEVGFIACMIPLIISITVFICEYLAPKIKRFLIKFTMYCLVRRFFVSATNFPH